MTVVQLVNIAIVCNVFASVWFAIQNKMIKAYYHVGVALLLQILLWGKQ